MKNISTLQPSKNYFISRHVGLPYYTRERVVTLIIPDVFCVLYAYRRTQCLVHVPKWHIHWPPAYIHHKLLWPDHIHYDRTKSVSYICSSEGLKL